MDFDWQKYLELAERINNRQSGSEALERTAISRAYYAMFHSAEDFAVANLSYQPTKEHPHDKLQTHLFHSGYKDASRVLSRMCKDRADCDYDRTLKSNISAKLKGTLYDANYLKGLLH